MRLGFKQLTADSSMIDTELMLSAALEKDRTYTLTHPEYELTQEQEGVFKEYLKKRHEGYSVAAIIGYQFFYGLKFKVTEDTLIPRPESELLVETGLHFLNNKNNAAILDVGTGCGNLIISLACHARGKNYTYYAADISQKALQIAKDNAQREQVTINFFSSNLFSGVPAMQYDLIIANLPYLSTQQLQEPSIKKEPIGALWGGKKGVEIYNEFLTQAPAFLADTGLILFEIDPVQEQYFLTKARDFFPFANIVALKDHSNKSRVISIQL